VVSVVDRVSGSSWEADGVVLLHDNRRVRSRICNIDFQREKSCAVESSLCIRAVRTKSWIKWRAKGLYPSSSVDWKYLASIIESNCRCGSVADHVGALEFNHVRAIHSAWRRHIESLPRHEYLLRQSIH